MLRHNHCSETTKQDQAVGNSDNSYPVKDEKNTVMMSTTDCHDAQLTGRAGLPVKMVTATDKNGR